MAKNQATTEEAVEILENNVSSTPVIDIDTFMNTEGVSSTWINGLMVYLSSRGGLKPRTTQEWKELLAAYQRLS